MEDDRSLIEKILNHEEQAFGVLVKKYQRLVYVTCYRIVKSQSDAEDLTQDVFIEIFRSLYHVRNDGDLSGWIYRISLNKSLSLLRKRNPVKASNSISIESFSRESNRQTPSADPETPYQRLEQEEMRDILFMAVDQLPENQKKVILLHKFENYSQKEICEKTGLSLVSVESLIYRAKSNLRKSLFKYFK